MLKMIYYGLLHDTDEFGGFFDYIDYAPDILDDLSGSILECFSKDICISSPLAELITSYPVELAYGLSLINCWNSSSGIPLWVLHNYPKVGWVMERLRDTPCENNECAYCRGAFNGKEGLKYFSNMIRSVPMKEKICSRKRWRLRLKENLFWLFFRQAEENPSHSSSRL